MTGYRNTDRWLTKQQYDKIRYKLKKMGVSSKEYDLTHIQHSVHFGTIKITFMFKPLIFKVSHVGTPSSLSPSIFSDKESAEKVKAEVCSDIDKTVEFIEFIKAFDEEKAEMKS